MDTFNQPSTPEEIVVKNILRDKEARWAYDYYSCTKTMHDASLGMAAQELNLQKTLLKKLDATLKNLSETIEKGRTKDAPEKKTPAEIEALEAEYTILYKEKCKQMIRHEHLESVHHDVQWKRYMEAKRYEMIQQVRNAFMIDGNLENLTHGVAHVSAYMESLKD